MGLRYIGLDVHQDTVSAVVLDQQGKLMMQSVIATRAAAILDFLHGILGTLHVTFEEGVHSAWLYDLLQHRVARVIVCDPRKNKLLKSGNKVRCKATRRCRRIDPTHYNESSIR